MIRAVIVAGVAASGKTTIGKELATLLGWTFADADALHLEENVRKMSAGKPLQDEDRWPWLELVGQAVDESYRKGEGIVMACSALRRKYAEFLTENRPFVRLAMLQADRPVIAERLKSRKDHFFPLELLDSQFETLELPPQDQVFDATQPAPEVAREIIRRFRLSPEAE